MPIYEYRCVKCGKVTEFIEGIGQDDVEKKCKYCGSIQLTKILSNIHVLSGKSIIGSQEGKTCCGRDERCEKPPCSDDGSCKR
ncbi:FmdB family zinc ribbon protein [Caldisericum sp.]|uniref:FmdB family zinc ribbon protein n=1 Tax=Caldisericum sp. TaxID=2499687 RepID=UPI003D0B71D1